MSLAGRTFARNGLLILFLISLHAGVAFTQSTTHKVYTDEDLSRLPRTGISVMGEQTAKSAPVAKPATPPTAASKEEQIWRDRARKLDERMASVDADLEKVRENVAFAMGRGYQIHIDALDLSGPDLLKEKAALKAQIDQLAEDARKAGADSGWLR
jgi:hypothetical protein